MTDTEFLTLQKQYAFWFPERRKSLFWASRFQIFVGGIPPDPTRVKGPYGPFSGHSRHLYWLLITNVVETPECLVYLLNRNNN